MCKYSICVNILYVNIKYFHLSRSLSCTKSNGIYSKPSYGIFFNGWFHYDIHETNTRTNYIFIYFYDVFVNIFIQILSFFCDRLRRNKKNDCEMLLLLSRTLRNQK